MSWYAIVEKVTGIAKSYTQQDSPPALIDNSLEAILITKQPDTDVMWNAATKTLIARPLPIIKDRIQDIIDDPDISVFLATLTSIQRQRLRDVISKHFGDFRFYA